MTPKKHDYVMRLYMYITSYGNLTYFYLDVSISILSTFLSRPPDRNVKVKICQVEI